jgi:protocatechuate 4,5-dioxygenase beta chain
MRMVLTVRPPRVAVDTARPCLTPDPGRDKTRERPTFGKDVWMATICAVVATTHHPFYLRASTAPPEERPPFADEWVGKVEAFRETLARARPDVLVMVGSDHFHQMWLDNLPQFLVGKAPFYDANYYNEEREFGLPRMLLRGQEDLSTHLLREGLDAGFDLAFSNELRVDHSITCPIITLRPQNDLPIVPIYTNIFAPPMPQPKRFVELGRAIRTIVESWPSDLRVAIIGSGHLSLELGGPRQFGPHGPDPEFDQKAVAWIASGDIDRALAEVTLDSLWLPGNATHGFMDFMLMMGVAGAGRPADYVDTLDLFHTMEAYFTWYPNGVDQ